jgi:hypothetical protein
MGSFRPVAALHNNLLKECGEGLLWRRQGGSAETASVWFLPTLSI